jgi:hypothetical protein
VAGIAAALVGIGAVAAARSLRASDSSAASPQVGFAEEVSLGETAYRDVCPSGSPIPSGYYDLGREFAGLERTSHRNVCNPAPPAGVVVTNGPSEAIGYVSVTYGSCKPISDAGCFPPLNVQSWPECARNPNTFLEAGREVALNPSDAVEFQSAPWIPARAFEEGIRLEIYSGDTTIVVFAGNRRLAHKAAMALASAAADRVPPDAAQSLQAAAREPGDASTCRNRLSHLSPQSIRPRRNNDPS